MTWQEIVFDILPLVISFVSAVILFFRTGQKRYIGRFVEILNQVFQSDTDSDVVVSSDKDSISFRPSDYGMTSDEVFAAFRSFLEGLKNADDK